MITGDQRALCRPCGAGRMTGRMTPPLPELPGVRHRTLHLPTGVRVHLAEAGPEDAPPVLCLHGWPQHWWIWRRVIPLLDGEYRLAVPRQPGRRLERMAGRRRLPQAPAGRGRDRPARRAGRRARARRRPRLGRLDRDRARRRRARAAAHDARAGHPAPLAADARRGPQRVALRLPGAARHPRAGRAAAAQGGVHHPRAEVRLGRAGDVRRRGRRALRGGPAGAAGRAGRPPDVPHVPAVGAVAQPRGRRPRQAPRRAVTAADRQPRPARRRRWRPASTATATTPRGTCSTGAGTSCPKSARSASPTTPGRCSRRR